MTADQENTNVVASQVFTPEDLLTLTTVYEDPQPPGKFIRDRHGYTHYIVQRCDTDDSRPSSKGMIVAAHGIGTCTKAFDEFASSMVQNGYSVLTYDFYGHGYSKYKPGSDDDDDDDDMWIHYTPDVFVDQLEDLLAHVKQDTNEEVVAMAGHSTGGLVAIAANHRWGTTKPDSDDDAHNNAPAVIPKLLLIAPALYAKKPLVARIADKIPTAMRSMFKYLAFTRKLIGISYMEAGEVAYARDPQTNEYVYPDAFKSKETLDSRLFGNVHGVQHHPYLSAAIVGVNNDILRSDLLPHHQKCLLEILQWSDERKIRAIIMWGDLDCTVPYSENHQEVSGWCDQYDNLTLCTMERLGHESMSENTPVIVEKVLAFMNA